MDYLKFIARVTSHIPDKRQVMVRYDGPYANAHRGKVKKAKLRASLRVGEEKFRRIPSKDRAEMIQITFVAEKPPPAQAVFQECLWAADPPAEYFP